MRQPGIRRDTLRTLRAARADAHALLQAVEYLPSFNHPALVVWAREDRVMPPEHGRRLAKLLPHPQLVEVTDSYTLVPLDQPAHPVERGKPVLSLLLAKSEPFLPFTGLRREDVTTGG